MASEAFLALSTISDSFWYDAIAFLSAMKLAI
jgi:hypothetical protein